MNNVAEGCGEDKRERQAKHHIGSGEHTKQNQIDPATCFFKYCAAQAAARIRRARNPMPRRLDEGLDGITITTTHAQHSCQQELLHGTRMETAKNLAEQGCSTPNGCLASRTSTGSAANRWRMPPHPSRTTRRTRPSTPQGAMIPDGHRCSRARLAHS